MIGILAISLVIVGSAAGYFHDQSIKGIYQSFSSQIAHDATLDSQNQQLQTQVQQLQQQVQQLQGLTRVTLAHGTISSVGGTPLYIFFDAQSGPSLSSGVVFNTNSYQYAYQYQVYLRSGVTYGVRIYHDTFLSGSQSCAGVPVLLTPTGSDYAQNFTC